MSVQRKASFKFCRFFFLVFFNLFNPVGISSLSVGMTANNFHSRGKRIFHQDARGKKLKGRLLFASASAAKPKSSSIVDEDEEAETDIEDHIDSQVENNLDIDDEISAEQSSSTIISNEGGLATPKVKVDKKVTTPIAPGAPHSPPATGRLLRSSRRSTEETPVHKPRKPSSPFDGWARVKGSIDTRGTSSKRPATPTSPRVDAKRPRC